MMMLAIAVLGVSLTALSAPPGTAAEPQVGRQQRGGFWNRRGKPEAAEEKAAEAKEQAEEARKAGEEKAAEAKEGKKGGWRFWGKDKAETEEKEVADKAERAKKEHEEKAKRAEEEARGKAKQAEKKAEQVQKETGKGSEQGQQQREEHRKKWWQW
jgi:hypothetical protein